MFNSGIINNVMEVSIIITTYKRKEQFKNALFSAINQLFNCEFEIIVVDDNGRNEYTNYVKKTIDEFNSSKVKLVAHEINSNGAVARNSGIKNSNGKYICFLDDDDIYHDDDDDDDGDGDFACFFKHNGYRHPKQSKYEQK